MKSYIGKNIIGTWKLVSWQYINEDGKPVNFFGDIPRGILMYDGFGNMNAQITKPERQNFSSDSLMSGNESELSEAFLSYFAYFGTYKEVAPCVIEHYVEGCLTPNWVGAKQTRFAALNDNSLVMSTPPIDTKEHQIVHHVAWERL